MQALRELAAGFPESAKDIRLNLMSVLEQSSLTPAQRFGVALATAWAVQAPALVAALLADAGSALPAATRADAQAAAAVMAMNNVLYRFRHMVGKSDYQQLPARLRMQRLASPAGDKLDFELFALAVSAVNGCESCIRAHEQVVLQAGLTPQHVLDVVRIAATVAAAATAAAMAGPVPA